jgi:hypothetical protein
MMRMLAAHGADPSHVQDVTLWGRRNKDSKYSTTKPGPTTVLMAALGQGRGGGFQVPERADREAKALECVKVAVEAGAPVNQVVGDDRTALETATALGYKSVVEYLTSKGAKLDRPARPLRREPRAEN